jgi:uncharacterized protein (TIGR03382 family)
VFLAQPVTDVAPTPVNLEPVRAATGVALTMVGFGETLSGSAGQLLFTAPKATVSCTEFAVNNALFLCVDQHSGAGICGGDGGGPALATIGGMTHVVGVASYGDPACAAFGALMRTDAIVTRSFLHAYAPELVPEDPDVTPPTPLVPDPGCDAGGGHPGAAMLLVVLGALRRRRRARR